MPTEEQWKEFSNNMFDNYNECCQRIKDSNEQLEMATCPLVITSIELELQRLKIEKTLFESIRTDNKELFYGFSACYDDIIKKLISNKNKMVIIGMYSKREELEYNCWLLKEQYRIELICEYGRNNEF